MTVFTDLQKLRCLERELKMRRKVYPRWVANKNMEAEKAEYEIAVMAEIAAEYRAKIPRADMQPELLP